MAHITYFDDDNSQKSGVFDIIDRNISTITFATQGGNKITLPWHRMIKVKERDVDE